MKWRGWFGHTCTRLLYWSATDGAGEQLINERGSRLATSVLLSFEGGRKGAGGYDERKGPRAFKGQSTGPLLL